MARRSLDAEGSDESYSLRNKRQWAADAGAKALVVVMDDETYDTRKEPHEAVDASEVHHAESRQSRPRHQHPYPAREGIAGSIVVDWVQNLGLGQGQSKNQGLQSAWVGITHGVQH